jgi:HSP20 family protein
MTTTTQSIPAAEVRTAGHICYASPAVSICEDDDGYTIEAEMPGVPKEGVHVTVENGELVFTGTKAPRAAGTRIHRETVRADYRRVFDLDPAVDTDHITARMHQGVLVLRLPKAQDKKPRRISVGD